MTLDLPPGDFAGYIFDLDGTLVDSMPLHYRAWNEAMQHAGLPHELDEDLFYSLGGVPTRRVAELMGEHYRLRLDPAAVFQDKEARFMARRTELRLIEPVAEFARKLAGKKPVSVASGGPRDIVQQTLELTGLKPLFPVVVTPEDVLFGKPAPDMFLLAAEKMGVPPKQCLVLEDAEPGIAAARTAGMKFVRVESRRLSGRSEGRAGATLDSKSDRG